MLASGLSTQLGAAIGSLAFPVLGPVGVVAVRQYVAAAVLLTVGRPRLRSFTRHQWGPVLLLAAVFGVVNLSLYTAIDRIGLGQAVTLEFLGPLTIALAGSRRRVDLGCAVLAAAGVVVLMRPRPTADYLGMGLALLAAACWAAYILLSRSIGQRIPGAQGTGAAAVLCPPWSTCPSEPASRYTTRLPPGRSVQLSRPESYPPLCRSSRTCSRCAAFPQRRSDAEAAPVSRSLHCRKGAFHARCNADRSSLLRPSRP
jgi:drug/metabolite transporter (DMT)-like permease